MLSYKKLVLISFLIIIATMMITSPVNKKPEVDVVNNTVIIEDMNDVDKIVIKDDNGDKLDVLNDVNDSYTIKYNETINIVGIFGDSEVLIDSL